MKVHVVIGSTGEYSDHREWPVCAYLSEQLAREHATAAERRAGELRAEHGDHDQEPDFDGCQMCENTDAQGRWHDPLWAELNEYDPAMRTDYSGTRYRVMSVDVVDATKGTA